MATKYEHEILERLGCDIAERWRDQRRLNPRIVDAMEPQLVRKLDELDGQTYGDERRCRCLAGKDSDGKHHDPRCGAWRPSI